MSHKPAPAIVPLISVFLLVAFLPGALAGQEQPGRVPWYQQVDINSFLSFAYTGNLNAPDSGKNAFRIFDAMNNSFEIQVFELVVQHTPTGLDDAGFRVDMTAGSSIPKVTRSSGLGSGDLDFHQAFLSYIAPVGRGLRLDFGKFITSMGYEVIEGYDGYNDNYSRSLLFGFAIPFTHTGMRCSYKFSDIASGQFMAVNGWDNAIDNNSSKTIGMQLSISPGAGLSLAGNYMIGPEKNSDNSDERQIFDIVGIYAPTSGWSAGVNCDYGSEARSAPGGGTAVWNGAAAYVKMNPAQDCSISLRTEIFNDPDGFRTGTVQTLREITLTPEYQQNNNLSFRIDLRLDASSENVFLKHNGPVNTQPTVGLNIVYIH